MNILKKIFVGMFSLFVSFTLCGCLNNIHVKNDDMKKLAEKGYTFEGSDMDYSQLIAPFANDELICYKKVDGNIEELLVFYYQNSKEARKYYEIACQRIDSLDTNKESHAKKVDGNVILFASESYLFKDYK